MSYDIYCYRSNNGIPYEPEADAIIAADIDKHVKNNKDAKTKLAIVKALTRYNPRLAPADFHEEEFATLTVERIEKAATGRYDHIEVVAPIEDPSISITVYDNHVFITTPYGYHGEQANQLFRDIKSYIDIIRETAGYLVSDPQTGQTYDPVVTPFDGLSKYLPTSQLASSYMQKENAPVVQPAKPWWKFW